MSIQPAGQDPPYAPPEDMLDFFDKYEAFLSDNEVLLDDGTVKDESDVTQSDVIKEEGPTNPTKDQVRRRLQAASDWIDSQTGHAWRARQIKNEHITLTSNYYWRAGSPLKLRKRQIITPLDPDEGDKLEVWRGNEWDDWLTDPDKDEHRDGDFWIEEETGMLYIYRWKMWFHRHKEIRISYRFGWEWPDVDDPDERRQNVPPAIREVCVRKAAAHYLQSQQYRITTPGNEEAPNDEAVADAWVEQCKEELEPFKEVRSVGYQ